MGKKKFKIEKEIKDAETLSSNFYTDKRNFYSSTKKIFSNSWQLITHTSEVNNTMPFLFMPDSISEPLLLTKDKDKINCLSNVCTHRGHLVCNKTKKTKSLVCRYHGRKFDFSGELKNAPGFDEANNFPRSQDDLRSFPIKEWMNFIFVSLKRGIDINPVLNDIESRVKGFPFNDIRLSKSISNTFEINAHWALYCENYLEGFHVPFVHKGLSKEINNSTYETILLDNGVVQYAKNHNNSNVYAYYYWIFPNIMLNFYHWGLSVNIVEPISPKKTKVSFFSYPIKSTKEVKEEIQSLIEVEREDQEVILSVQRGINSRYYKRGRYSPEHERGVHHFHRLLSSFL